MHEGKLGKLLQVVFTEHINEFLYLIYVPFFIVHLNEFKLLESGKVTWDFDEIMNDVKSFTVDCHIETSDDIFRVF